MVEFPKYNDYKEWKNYKKGNTNFIELFYHPYQSILIFHIINLLRRPITSSFFLKDTNDLLEIADRIKEESENGIKIKSLKSSNSQIYSKIGLLMLLQEPYGSFFKFDIFNNEDIYTDYEKWLKWRENNIDPIKLLKLTGLSEKEVEEFFKWVCMHQHLMIHYFISMIFYKLLKRN